MAHVDFQLSRRRGLAEHRDARRIWSKLETFGRLLFREGNAMPVKYCL
jgi:dihydrodipicolinate synthase/N-acetylneuraminate lyase